MLGVGLGLAGLVACAAALATTLAAVHPAAGGSGQILLAGLRFTYPSVNTAGALLVVLAGVGALALAVAARAAWRQWWRYRRFVARIGPLETFERDPRVRVIADPRLQAFCAGYVRPTVYVSRRTVELLSEPELDAVLAHEHHHRRGRDPLRVACGRIVSEALFFLPVLRSLCDRCADEAELCADQAAIHASGGRTAPLASALLAFEERAPAGASGISPERVDALLGQPNRWRPPMGRLVVSLVVLLGASVFVWLIGGSASARATFNLPFLSSQPCVVMAVGLPTLGLVGGLIRSRGRVQAEP